MCGCVCTCNCFGGSIHILSLKIKYWTLSARGWSQEKNSIQATCQFYCNPTHTQIIILHPTSNHTLGLDQTYFRFFGAFFVLPAVSFCFMSPWPCDKKCSGHDDSHLWKKIKEKVAGSRPRATTNLVPSDSLLDMANGKMEGITVLTRSPITYTLSSHISAAGNSLYNS